jgi:hypothetical protein
VTNCHDNSAKVIMRRTYGIIEVVAMGLLVASCGAQVDHGRLIFDSCEDDPTTGGSFMVKLWEDGHVEGYGESSLPCSSR